MKGIHFSAKVIKIIKSNFLKLCCLLSITLLLASCASETSPQTTDMVSSNTAETESQSLASNGQEIECRSLKVTGSNLKKRFCDTKANWDSQRSRSRSTVDEYSRQTNSGSGIQPPQKLDGNVAYQ